MVKKNEGGILNIYKGLNQLTEYIENNLEEEIEYEALARILGVNAYTMQRLFSMITNIPLSEYIRKRRLSTAGIDLYQEKQKVIDIAVKYQYNNATSFSRAFEKFHGIKPSAVNQKTILKNFPRIVFNEEIKNTKELTYEIIALDQMTLYGTFINTDNQKIGEDAPKFIKEIKMKYGKIDYGMISYNIERECVEKYYCLLQEKHSELEQIIIPSSKWLKFRIDSQDEKDIQYLSHCFYEEFLPSTKYNLKEIPELEFYHDGITDFLVAIY